MQGLRAVVRRDVTKIGGVYSAGGQLIVQERPTNSVRKKRNGLFGDPRYVVSKGQPIRGPAQRRQAEIRTRSRPTFDWTVEESLNDKEDLVKITSANERMLGNICRNTLNGPVVHWKARRRAQLIPRAKLRAPLPNYQKIQLTFSSDKIEDDQEQKKHKNESKNKMISTLSSSVLQREPQMIRVKENPSPASHLHSEKIRISRDAAIFEIKRESPDKTAKISSCYEIYDSSAKPFDETYRELASTSSTSSTMSSSGESHASSISSSGLSETTTYITCSSEIEPVQMTGFHCIDDHVHRQTISVYNEQCYEDIKEATNNYSVLPSTASRLAHRSGDSDRANGTVDLFENSAEERKIIADTRPFANVSTAMNATSDGCAYAQRAVAVKTWTTSEATNRPLKSPSLLQQMICARGQNGFRCCQLKPTACSIYKKKQYTSEPSLDANSSTAVIKCRSMTNLELGPPSPPPLPPPILVTPLSKAASEVNLNAEKRQRERERITKTISLMLENRRSQMLHKVAQRQLPQLKVQPTVDQTDNDALVNNNIELIESRKTIALNCSCRVTGELLKRDHTASKTNIPRTDHRRNVFTLPRSAESHRTQLQRHFYYPQYAVKNASYRVPDEELPDPDKVQNVRELFERVLKIGSFENISTLSKQPNKKDSYATFQRPTPEIRQPLSILTNRKPLHETLSVNTGTTNRVQWTDNGSLSSGVESDISAEMDLELSPKGGATSSSECSSKEDAIFTSSSDENLSTTGSKDAYNSIVDEDLGKPISPDVLNSIHAYGTSITYYGGKIIASSKGYSRSPMTMTIMNEIKHSLPDYHANRKLFLVDDKQFAKFRLIKSNSCGSRLELSDTDEYGCEYEERKRSRCKDANNTCNKVKKEPDMIKEEEAVDMQTTQNELTPEETRLWPKTKETAFLFENNQRNGNRINVKDWLENNGGATVETIKTAAITKTKSCHDMEFEEFEVLNEKN